MVVRVGTLSPVHRLAWAGAVLVILSAGLGLWAFRIEPDRLVVVERRLALPDWPADLAPLRLAAISDLHAGAPFVDQAKIADVVGRINALDVDAAVLLGDYVIHGVIGGEPVAPSDFAPMLGRIEAPLGIYAVLGNHDWWHGRDPVLRAFEAAGIVVLENRALPLVRPGAEDVWLVGLGDLWEGGPDVATATAAVPPGATAIAMTHNPDLFAETPIEAALLLAGHSHGGQVWLPFLGPPIVPSRYGARYARGHIVEQGRQIYVTSGIGTSLLPLRFGVPPEIVVLTLGSTTSD